VLDALLLALVESAKVVLTRGGVEGDFLDGGGGFAAFWRWRRHGRVDSVVGVISGKELDLYILWQILLNDG